MREHRKRSAAAAVTRLLLASDGTGWTTFGQVFDERGTGR